MNRLTKTKVESIPETYSDGHCVIAAFDGVTCVGIISEDETKAFMIPMEIFETLLKVVDMWQQQELADLIDAQVKGQVN